jgi:hypothetical protein
MAQTTAGSGFEYGIDLKMQDPVADAGGPSGVKAYTKANIRMEDDVVVMVDAGAPVNGTTGDNFAGTGSLYVDSTAGVVYQYRYNQQPNLGSCWYSNLMLTHKDPEVQVMLGLLESQRDHVMGIVAMQAKQIEELKAKLAAQHTDQENKDGNAI